jgi:hypothetical protein
VFVCVGARVMVVDESGDAGSVGATSSRQARPTPPNRITLKPPTQKTGDLPTNQKSSTPIEAKPALAEQAPTTLSGSETASAKPTQLGSKPGTRQC